MNGEKIMFIIQIEMIVISHWRLDSTRTSSLSSHEIDPPMEFRHWWWRRLMTSDETDSRRSDGTDDPPETGRRWGGAGVRITAACQSNVERERETYLKRQQPDDRLTMKMCCRAIG